jgi:hypothetical protein
MNYNLPLCEYIKTLSVWGLCGFDEEAHDGRRPIKNVTPLPIRGALPPHLQADNSNKITKGPERIPQEASAAA